MVSVHALVTVGGAVTKSGARVCASSVTDELRWNSTARAQDHTGCRCWALPCQLVCTVCTLRLTIDKCVLSLRSDVSDRWGSPQLRPVNAHRRVPAVQPLLTFGSSLRTRARYQEAVLRFVDRYLRK
jgi:hypothetical protein